MDPELWRWIWLMTAAVFVVGEILTTGMFFMLPFAIGAAVATVLAFTGAAEGWQWLAFVSVSALAFAAFRPLVRRLDAPGNPVGVGASRLIGETGIVTVDLAPVGGELGAVRIGREEWHAEAADGGPLAAGTTVEVVEIAGTRAVVRPAD